MINMETNLKRVLISSFVIFLVVSTAGILEGEVNVEVQDENELDSIYMTGEIDFDQIQQLEGTIDTIGLGIEDSYEPISKEELLDEEIYINIIEENFNIVDYQNREVTVEEGEFIEFEVIYEGVSISDTGRLDMSTSGQNFTYTHLVEDFGSDQLSYSSSFIDSHLLQFDYKVHINEGEIVSHNGDEKLSDNTVVWNNFDLSSSVKEIKVTRPTLIPDISSSVILISSVVTVLILSLFILLRSKRSSGVDI